ncbi:hypothetical protein CAAN1_16S01882 [[Candida] anglica]|uniref:Vacuolar protein sorting-associated protein 51 homolog n=1 Tax=[Candida] anglica TaxID=148631 RepID=A0ABP0EEM0_9ASCO
MSDSIQLNKRSNPKTPIGSPVLSGGNRKVSAGRKALQQFYHLQEPSNQSEPITEEIEPSDLLKSLSDPTKFAKYTQTSSIEDILKLRNSITHTLNTHDSEKKSIIYDNYYELIKLSQVLQGLSSAKTTVDNSTTNGLSSLGIFTERKSTPSQEISDEYLDSVFNSLTTFVTDRVSKFNTDFETIVQSSKQDLDDNDASSLKALNNDDDDEVALDINTEKLEHEINSLLQGVGSIPKEDQQQLKSQMKEMVATLGPKNKLLANQLSRISDQLTIN